MSLDSSEVPEDDDDRVPCSGFRVKYLGCATFTRKRGRGRILKGISSMQRPLLELYAGARKRGEAHRSIHPLALDQRLDVLDYGLVVAQKDQDLHNDSNQELVLVKVLTPLSNAVLWAAVRFQARALRKRVFGAAFVPIACCDGVLDRKGYLRLDAKHRFLVSLSHPSVFACVFRRVSDPRSFECHAFACGSAREALALGSAVSLVRGRCDLPPVVRLWPAQPLPSAALGPPRSVDTDETRTSSDMVLVPSRRGQVPSRRKLPIRRLPDQRIPGKYYDQRRYNNDRLLKTTESEEESNSYASVHKGTRRVERPHKAGGQRPSRSDVEDNIGMNGWAILPSAPLTEPCSSAAQTSTPFFPLLDTANNETAPSSSNYSCSLPPSDIDTPNPELGIKHMAHRGSYKAVHKDVSTMTDRPVRVIHEEVLAKTIDLSSESGSAGGSSTSSSTLAPFRRTNCHSSKAVDTTETGSAPTQPVKYTYFGYETFRPPTSGPGLTHASSTNNTTNNVARDQASNRIMGRAVIGQPKKKFVNKVAPQPTGPTHNTKGATEAKVVSIQGNGTGKVTISVPFAQKNKQRQGNRQNGGSSGRSSATSTQTDLYYSFSAPDGRSSLLPVRGVRSFRSDRGVGDWSTLSQTTSDDASCLGSQKHLQTNRYSSSSSSSSRRSIRRQRQRNQHHQQQPQHKMIRWRSEDRLPTQRTKSSYAFFWSLKRLSLQSLTKAKHKTGKFISSMRTKLMGQKKSSEGSEDSAYDTSEVCLSPDGRTYNRSCTLGTRGNTGSKAKRQQSWSFHDLRSATEERQRQQQSSPTFAPLKASTSHTSPKGCQFGDAILLRSSSSTALLHQQQHKRKQRRKLSHRRRLSSSDSGVEEYPSDQGSCLIKKGGASEPDKTNPKVTRVEIHHGMSVDSFQRWSHTNLQDELGYIP